MSTGGKKRGRDAHCQDGRNDGNMSPDGHRWPRRSAATAAAAGAASQRRSPRQTPRSGTRRPARVNVQAPKKKHPSVTRTTSNRGQRAVKDNYDSQSRGPKLKVEDALAFLQKVRMKFMGDKNGVIYNQFLDTMKNFKANK